MKKRIFTAAAVLLLLAAFVGTAFPAGRTKNFGGVRLPVNTVLMPDEAKMPRAGGLTLETAERVWQHLSHFTGFDAFLVYDPSETINAGITKDEQGDFILTVHRGILETLRTEDELAAVFAHEIGHGVKGHHDKTVQRQTGLGLLVNLLSRALGKGSLGEIAAGAGGALVNQGYSREQEVEADDYGVEISAKAGFSPWGLYTAIQRMADAGVVAQPGGFNSHPPTERRMTRLKEKALYWEKKLSSQE